MSKTLVDFYTNQLLLSCLEDNSLEYKGSLNDFKVYYNSFLLVSAREVRGCLFLESPFTLDKSIEFGSSILYDSVEQAVDDTIAMIGEFKIKLDLFFNKLKSTTQLYSIVDSNNFLSCLRFLSSSKLILLIDKCGFNLCYQIDNLKRIDAAEFNLAESLSEILGVNIALDVVSSDKLNKSKSF